MTRFKELRRINTAIEHKNAADLRWALEYCKMRIGIADQFAKANRQRAAWSKVMRQVQKALDDLENSN